MVRWYSREKNLQTKEEKLAEGKTIKVIVKMERNFYCKHEEGMLLYLCAA
jgi:hypothetical protein